MEAVSSSDISLNFFPATFLHISEDIKPYINNSEMLTFKISSLISCVEDFSFAKPHKFTVKRSALREIGKLEIGCKYMS
jgi:hypothetical protein